MDMSANKKATSGSSAETANKYRLSLACIRYLRYSSEWTGDRYESLVIELRESVESEIARLVSGK